MGLSPRVRGSLCYGVWRPRETGSIPACAGEPPSCQGRGERSRVYPRVCGGASNARRDGNQAAGLSPRVRGSQCIASSSRQPCGSIPACAGEPIAFADIDDLVRVYPRVCGGARVSRLMEVAQVGLSPRVRGSLVVIWMSISLPGSIPACAGEPFWRFNLFAVWWVYPRVCGGAELDIAEPAAVEGLSPRVRGSLLYRVLYRPPLGSIPACAGEPMSANTDQHRLRVYPRVCGGARAWRWRSRPTAGLSPRVRGSH